MNVLLEIEIFFKNEPINAVDFDRLPKRLFGNR